MEVFVECMDIPGRDPAPVAVEFIFEELTLHRIEANILPDNEQSIKLVKKFGFKKEGIARKYLYINGQWKDHARYSLINSKG